MNQTKPNPVTVLLELVVDDDVHDACPLFHPARPRAPPRTLPLSSERHIHPEAHLPCLKPARQDRPPDEREDRPPGAQWLLRLQGAQQTACRGVGGQREGASSLLGWLLAGGKTPRGLTRTTCLSGSRREDLHQRREKL